MTDAAANVTVTFSEAIRRDAVGGQFTTDAQLKTILTLKKTDAAGADIAYTASIDSGKTVVTIDPTSAELEDGDVYVAVSAGYYDVVGNPGAAASATFTVDAKSSEARLSGLAVTSGTSAGGTFTPLDIGTFLPSRTAYSVTAPGETTHVKLTPTATHSAARIGVRKGSTGNFTPVPSGGTTAAIPLDVGPNVITVLVTAQDSMTQEYTVVIGRQALIPTVSLSASPSQGGRGLAGGR